MLLAVCADDRLGMTFHQRRQSQDRAVRDSILQLCGDRPLRVSPYTARQFPPEQQSRLEISESFLESAGEEDICFAESGPLAPYLPKIRRLILFRWNRHYPSDSTLDLPFETWTLLERREFPGSSHEKITMEVYEP